MIKSIRPLLHAVVAVAAYAASAPLIVVAMSQLGRPCVYNQMQTYCRYGDAYEYEALPYFLTASVLAAIMLIARIWFRPRPWYPLIIVFGSVALFAMAYDTILQRPVIQGDKIINDTFNTLRAAIMASFLLVFLVARRMTFSFAGVVRAVAFSFIAAGAVSALFQQISPHVIGATRLYLLFLLYAFGGFGLHMMTVSSLFAKGRLESVE